MKDWLVILGTMIITASIGVLLWLYVPVAYYQAKYQARQNWFNLLKKVGRWQSAWDVPTWTAAGDYMLYIPKIEAKAPVIPQINAAYEKEYFAALKKGVVEASGLSVPGRRGTTYLFAHSTDNPLNFSRYNAIFYLLDKLEKGDKIEVFYKGNYYHYAAEKMEILSPTNVRYLVPQYKEELLILQTCYPFGTTKNRLVVVAKRVS